VQLSVIIVSWNTCKLLDRCLETLLAEVEKQQLSIAKELTESELSAKRQPLCEIFVIDNASADNSAELVQKKYPQINLIANKENLGFAKANNQALKQASGKYILLLNPDTEIQAGALKVLIDFLDHNLQAGVIAPQLLNTDGSVQMSCRAFPSFIGMLSELTGVSRFMPAGSKLRSYKMLDWQHDTERQVDQPEGACLLVRKELFDQVGLFDEEYFMLFEEVDWLFSVRKVGWQIWFTPTAKVIHHMGQAIKQVKVKMILSSHKGMYRYWYKHHRFEKWYLDTFVYGALMTLAGLRICSYRINRVISKQPT